MTEGRDPQLEALFLADREAPPDDAFTGTVDKAIDARRRKIFIGRALILLAIVALEIALNLPVQSSLGVLTELLNQPVLPVGDGWWWTLAAPLNSIAGIVGMLLVGMHYLYRRFLR